LNFQNELKQELNSFKGYVEIELQQLRNKENFKIKSFKDLKEELKAIFSIHGYSAVLNTNKLFKKVFWLINMITLFAICMFFVNLNFENYQSNDVVTQIKLVENATMLFPAITFCFSSDKKVNLSDKWGGLCNFDSIQNCSINDFENTPLKMENIVQYTKGFLNCYTFNGGKNRSGQDKNIFLSNRTGIESGLVISFNLTENEDVLYYTGDNSVHPTLSELRNVVSQDEGKVVYVGLKRIVDEKLPEPHSPCSDNINSKTSYLVKEIIDQNMTYRQENCYELCYLNYLNTFADSQKIEAYYKLNFDYKKNCSQLCPLECFSTSFEFFQSETNRKKFQNSLTSQFFYTDRKYTKLTQIIKTTGADFISNTGGTLGLFLDFTFLSIYRTLIFIFDNYFA
jgi:hypothetical protein